MNTFVILLRGITPTGKNKVPMAPLRTALTKAGLKDVRTYIQSGNVIAATQLSQTALERRVHETIQQSFGGDIVVVARTASQFAGMLKRNPFPNAVATNLYFTLFAKTPEKQLLKEFLSTDFSPDQVRFVKDTLYTLYATKHKDSRFNNNYFERHLGVLATTRNGNTVARLLALANAP